MLFKIAITLLCFFQFQAFAQVEENNVEFTISPSILLSGKIQVAYEWLTPNDFLKKELSIIDTFKVSGMNADNNQLAISKLAFISKRNFDTLSLSIMNNSAFISKMLNSVSISSKSSDTWRVTNKVKAYGIPFKVSFDFKVKEIPLASVPAVARFLRDEAGAIVGQGRERLLLLDMSNFSQLMYRNVSYVYMKEIANNQTMLVAGIIGGANISTANLIFNYPPFSETESTMINNLRTQIMGMAKNIQN
jgi:hypothetical protein